MQKNSAKGLERRVHETDMLQVRHGRHKFTPWPPRIQLTGQRAIRLPSILSWVLLRYSPQKLLEKVALRSQTQAGKNLLFVRRSLLSWITEVNVSEYSRE